MLVSLNYICKHSQSYILVSTVALCVTYCNDAFIHFCVPQFIHTFSDSFYELYKPVMDDEWHADLQIDWRYE